MSRTREIDGRRFRFGPFELLLDSRELCNGTAVIRLQDQPFEILRVMLEHPGLVVTREELRKRLWPEGTFVDFEHSLNAAVKRLRAALGDDADHPRFIETVPRRGYRFIGDVETASGDVSPDRDGRKVRFAILPFPSLCNGGGDDDFTEGLMEELISQLGRVVPCGVCLIARRSSMMFQETRERASEIGRALSADYLLEGSVRLAGDRVRITARLIETAGETQLWSDTYDRRLDDRLTVQADVSACIAESLARELTTDPALDPQGPTVVAT